MRVGEASNSARLSRHVGVDQDDGGDGKVGEERRRGRNVQSPSYEGLGWSEMVENGR